MSIRHELLQEIEAFLAKHKLSATALGTAALKDSAFMIRLRAGRNIGIESVDRLRTYMRNYPKQPPKREKSRRRKGAESLAIM